MLNETFSVIFIHRATEANQKYFKCNSRVKNQIEIDLFSE